MVTKKELLECLNVSLRVYSNLQNRKPNKQTLSIIEYIKNEISIIKVRDEMKGGLNKDE